LDRDKPFDDAYPFSGRSQLSRRRFTQIAGTSLLAGGLGRSTASAQDATPAVVESFGPTLHVSSASVRIDEAFDVHVSGM
jgi:hypothetical protein